jgi:hypothetical protein
MTSLVLTLTTGTSRNGQKKEFREVVVQESRIVSISMLHKAVKKVQAESNAALTVIVNAEKATEQTKNGTPQNNVVDSTESDISEEDEGRPLCVTVKQKMYSNAYKGGSD